MYHIIRMISYITGTIQSKSSTDIVLLTSGGVGYAVAMSRSAIALLQIGQELALFTYMKVSDSDLSLFGFETPDQRNFFELLLSVKGVGPKSAMNILSLGSIDDITGAIARGDATYLSAVQGMGKKTAERLCVELKNKVSVSATQNGGEQNGDARKDVIDALVGLGYSKDESNQRIQTLDTAGKTSEELIRMALQQQ